MINLLKFDKDFFKENGYITNDVLSSNKEFEKISRDFKNSLNEILSKNKHQNLGGYKSGNLNINPGKYGVKIFSLLNDLNFKNYFNFLTDEKIEDFKPIFGGNLNLINSKNQFFHTDGNWNPRMIVVNIATTKIGDENGPLEIIEKSHSKKMSYFQFIIKSLFFKKKKIRLNFGDILIREHRLWHRGTKNKSEINREMIGIALLKGDQENHKISEVQNLYLHSNIFGISKREKLKEYMFFNFKFILFFYKLLISIIKKN